MRYINCGDWVESCTAIAEHADGQFEIITWAETDAVRPLLPPPEFRLEEEREIAA